MKYIVLKAAPDVRDQLLQELNVPDKVELYYAAPSLGYTDRIEMAFHWDPVELQAHLAVKRSQGSEWGSKDQVRFVQVERDDVEPLILGGALRSGLVPQA